MKLKAKRWVAVFLAICILSGVSVFAIVNYPSAKLVFDGVTLENNSGTTQAFLQVNLRNVEALGVGFTLRYDRNYVELSKAADNQIINSDAFTTEFFTQNTQQFPTDTLDQDVMGGDITVQSGYGTVTMDIFPNPFMTDTNSSPYIKKDADDNYIFDANTNQGVTFGTISFLVKDPAAFARLSSAELLQIFTIDTVDGKEYAYTISYIDSSVFPPIINYDTKDKLYYDFKVDNSVQGVVVDNNVLSVTAPEIYKVGTEQDLIDYLNAYASSVTVTYANTTQIPDTVVWGDKSKGFSYTVKNSGAHGMWEPKGGSTYVVTQQYNDKFVITAEITVETVSVIGYNPNDDYMVLSSDPLAFVDLKLPEKANMILDKIVPGYNNYEVDIDQASWMPNSLPADFTTPNVFTGNIDTTTIPPWATYNLVGSSVSVTRCVGNKLDAPIVSASVDNNGVMTIVVESVGTVSPLAADTVFSIKMPNGDLIDSTQFTSGGTYNVQLNVPSDGKATITVDASDATNDHQVRLHQYINMGDRMGQFQICVDGNGKYRSDWTAFAMNARQNVYTGTDYVFDYSGTKQALFPFNKGTTVLPSTITLPQSDTVGTTYSGYNGVEPGDLKTITVDSWTMVGDTSKMGNDVTVTGTLSDKYYTSYGQVDNIDNKTVTLKLTVSTDYEQDEKIKDIEDFVFDKQTVGFVSNDIQTESFDLANKGYPDIYGATVQISNDNFILKTPPRSTVFRGDATKFEISTKLGLGVGTYTSTVTVSSNRTTALDQFTISFEVTANPVYKVDLSTNNEQWGKVEFVDALGNAAGATYEENETVYIVATNEEDCTFKQWQEIDSALVSFAPDDTTVNPTFVMPNSAVTIEGVFEETVLAKLRLSDLQSRNEDDSQNKLKELTVSGVYTDIPFDPKTKDYYVIVPSSVEKNKLRFEVGNLSINNPDDVTISVTHSILGGINTTQTGNVFETDLFALSEMANKNTLEIKASCDGNDKIYTVHVLREMSEYNRVVMEYGNSPYGLIEDDSAIDKTAAKTAFDKKYSFDPTLTPAQGDSSIVYHPSAWGIGKEAPLGTVPKANEYINYDKDSSALFVYQGNDFKDPGIKTLKNSLGEAIDTTIKSPFIKKVIKVYEMTSTSPISITNDFETVKNHEIELNDIANDGGGIVNELTGLRLRPGRYSIEYTYKDYDDSNIIVSRPLIILSGLGDVDNSKIIDTQDYAKIMNRYNERMPYEYATGYTTDGYIYKYRICDVNKDGNVNSVDANTINASIAGTAIKPYYSILPKV